MEETLGKRIAANRKRLKMTQDALAERMGVTAQAVSKWENDQSCPDITMLPKLAQVFGTSTDALLGLTQEIVHEAEILHEETDKEEPEGFHIAKGDFEFQWDAGRRSSLGFAVWILLSGFLLFLTNDAGIHAGLWDILWTTGLFLFGLFGILYPRFSIFRLGCAFLGGYFLCVEVFGKALNIDFLLPVFLMCFGFSLLVKALRKPKQGTFHITRNGKNIAKSNCVTEGELFHCTTGFGENTYLIQLPRLSGGDANVSFGEMEIDLSGCEEIADNCSLDLNCSFGELTLLIPRGCRVVHKISTAFASFDIIGSPEANAGKTILLNGNASFGQITVRYL